eukprot:jgi/Botrbrau1/16642/Bobra.0068s0059.1
MAEAAKPVVARLAGAKGGKPLHNKPCLLCLAMPYGNVQAGMAGVCAGLTQDSLDALGYWKLPRDDISARNLARSGPSRLERKKFALEIHTNSTLAGLPRDVLGPTCGRMGLASPEVPPVMSTWILTDKLPCN